MVRWVRSNVVGSYADVREVRVIRQTITVFRLGVETMSQVVGLVSLRYSPCRRTPMGDRIAISY